MSPILIATILRPQGPTGVQTHFNAFARYLRTRQADVALVTPYDVSPVLVYPAFALRKVLAPLSKAAEVSWYRTGHALVLRRALRSRLAAGNPCVIYAQCPISAEVALRARRTAQQRVVMVVHFNVSQADEWAGQGMIQPGGALWQHIRHKEAEVLPQLDGIVFVSRFMRDVLTHCIPEIADVPQAIIPNFVADPGPVQPQSRFKADLVSIGTLEARKNQAYLLEILAAAGRAGSRLTLTLIGDGPDRAHLESLAQQLGIASQVTFAGQILNAVQELPHYRAYIHAARMENLPITLIEALSQGCPVLAPAVGGIPEIVEDGREGRLIPLDNAQEAARIITTTMQDPQRVALHCEAARVKFVRRFELSATAARLADFLGHQPARSVVRAGHAGCAPA
jgi:glycosyltransferase involved in cell wall biosynthesis